MLLFKYSRFVVVGLEQIGNAIILPRTYSDALNGRAPLQDAGPVRRTPREIKYLTNGRMMP